MTLKEYRNKKGYQVKFVANYLCISPKTLNLKERDNKFTTCQIKMLMELYGINDVSEIEGLN